MLCQSCLTSFQAAYEAVQLKRPRDILYKSSETHQESLSDLYQSILEECWICRQLWASMLYNWRSERDYESDFSKHDHYEHCFEAELELLQQWNMSEDLSRQLEMSSCGNLTLQTTQYTLLQFTLNPKPTSENKVELNTYTGPDVARTSISASRSSDLWKQWFHTCSKFHKDCRGLGHKLQPFSPKRLVEIATDNNGGSFTWRIVSGADIGNVPYLSLSHCWGSSDHKRLLKKNQMEFSEPSNYSNLPKSFRDAFSISFSLSFRFIWIDSLCIIQDDDEDWKTQASMMGAIYRNASCNIAASSAVGGNGGCFATKKKPEEITLYAGRHRPIEYEINSGLPYYNDIVDAPLNQRGWVLQERFLARKQLSFA
jgi:hypothetical protein